ncbi:GA-binding protein subunit beta-1-like [Contarinia nasturtii]|uniref:GA-binding protein subunit beta-1-like n=1 Tax=Contarinia nasturtii TaxID=265458 RepID=UPI0012D456BB|nr:GA-binding protein subunit beta-1-like [Contarinia nasturtii]
MVKMNCLLVSFFVCAAVKAEPINLNRQPDIDFTGNLYGIKFLSEQIEINNPEVFLKRIVTAKCLIIHANNATADGELMVKNPLHYTAQYGLIDAIKCLIERGLSVNSEDSLKRSPLHYAARWGHAEVIKCLIEHGANVNAIDIKKRTALHYAARWGNVKEIQLLIKNGANVFVYNDKGETPIAVAIEYGENEAAEVLRIEAELNGNKDQNDNGLWSITRLLLGIF